MSMKIKPISAQAESQVTWLNTWFSFGSPYAQVKAAQFLAEANYDFSQDVDKFLQVQVQSDDLPLLIARLGGVLSSYELTMTRLVSTRQAEPDTGCKVFRLRAMDKLIRFPSDHKDVMSGPSQRSEAAMYSH